MYVKKRHVASQTNVCGDVLTNVCGDAFRGVSLEILKNILPDTCSIVADVTADTLVTTCKGLMGCYNTRPQKHHG